MKLRIGFGVTVLARGLLSGFIDGIGNYTHELYRRLADSPDTVVSPLSFGYASFKKAYKDKGGEVVGRFAPLVAGSILTGLPFWRSERLGGRMDIFHATDHHIPNFRNIPIVATIHDAIPFSHPEWVPLKHRLIISPVFRRSTIWADKVVTVSDYSKEQIIEHLRITPERIVVIPGGVDQRWFQPVCNSRLEELRCKYRLPSRYVIFVGTLQPRKNLERLVKAYHALPLRTRREVGLVIVGRAGWGCDELLTFLMKEANVHNIHWLSYIPNLELEVLFKGAACLSFPSLVEGFGLPVVEAFAAGVPVLTSSTTSLPEVAGNAAMLVDPLDIDAIAEGMRCLLEDSALGEKLRARGLERARLFSWERVAESMVDVYRSVVG